MSDDLIKIYSKFGFESQIAKLLEEMYEFKTAFSTYRMAFYMERETKEQFMDVIDELNDMVNVARGIAICKYAIPVEEQEAMRTDKIIRTLWYIRKMGHDKTYEQV